MVLEEIDLPMKVQVQVQALGESSHGREGGRVLLLLPFSKWEYTKACGGSVLFQVL